MGDLAVGDGRLTGPVRGSLPGRTLAYTYEVCELDPGRRLVMSTAEGPFPMETTYTWGTPDPDERG